MFQEIKIRRGELLGRLQSNQKEHIQQYNAAMSEWRIDCAEILANAEHQFEEDETWPQMPTRPEEFQREYQTAIEAAMMSAEDVLTLTEQEFRQFIMDEWDWSPRFFDNTIMYGKVKRRA